MKITVDIDCTAAEARAFLGLPDVAPLQQALTKEMQRRMLESLAAMDPEALFKTWLPSGLQGWEQLQKSFWSQMTGAGGKEPGKTGTEKSAAGKTSGRPKK